ncbi:MAG: hypothetical protein DRN06_07800 [Thermoprotei archaeon]|nr:MAG: hypothetical protein DRN06_07800 [Thermoprotei archaeon]
MLYEYLVRYHAGALAAVAAYAVWLAVTYMGKPDQVSRPLHCLADVVVLYVVVIAIDAVAQAAAPQGLRGLEGAYNACRAAAESGTQLLTQVVQSYVVGVLPIVGYPLLAIVQDSTGWSRSLIEYGVSLYSSTAAIYWILALFSEPLLAAGAFLLPLPRTRRVGAVLVSIVLAFTISAPMSANACSRGAVEFQGFAGFGSIILNSTTSITSLNVTKLVQQAWGIADALGKAAPTYFNGAIEAAFWAGLAATVIGGLAYIFKELEL